MRRLRSKVVPYREHITRDGTVTIRRSGWQTWQDAAWGECRICATDRQFTAEVRVFVEQERLRPNAKPDVARMVLKLLGIIDGVETAVPPPAEQYACAAILMLPLPRRALLYYDACHVLGYDPAEESDPCRTQG